MRNLKIGILFGYWSTNIGNSFFQLGAEILIRKAVQKAKINASIVRIPDFSGYANSILGKSCNAYEPIVDAELDLIFVLGPFIRDDMDLVSVNHLKRARSNGTKIAILSAAQMPNKVSDEMLSDFLSSLEIDFITTRDPDTACRLQTVCSQIDVSNHVDTAFFISELNNIPKLNIEDKICLSIDQIREPKIGKTPFTNSTEYKTRLGPIYIKTFGFDVESKMINFLTRIMKINKVKTDDLFIRLDHRYNPAIPKKIYSQPNTFSADIPEGYLALYKSAKLTISNRVHACVASLSFGNQAILFSKNLRTSLFKNVTKSFDPTSGVNLLEVDHEKLEFEKKIYVDRLASYFDKL